MEFTVHKDTVEVRQWTSLNKKILKIVHMNYQIEFFILFWPIFCLRLQACSFSSGLFPLFIPFTSIVNCVSTIWTFKFINTVTIIQLQLILFIFILKFCQVLFWVPFLDNGLNKNRIASLRTLLKIKEFKAS